MQGEYPTEVQPLVDDLNALLEEREKAVKRAMATAGDLAHGLKTPLAMLAQEADARRRWEPELAASIGQQVERMSRQVNYHLARARAASGSAGAERCPVAPAVEALIRTLDKLYAGRSLDISSDSRRNFAPASSGKIWMKYSATFWTTHANGRSRRSS